MKRFTVLFSLLVLVGAGARPAEAPVVPEPSDTDVMLETIGVLSGQGILLTYISIGAAADGYALDTYSAEEAGDMLGTSVGVSKVCRDQLGLLLKTDAIEGEDIGYVNELIDVYSLLISEADAFANYMRTGKEGHLKTYNAKREKAWSRIERLLNLKGEDAPTGADGEI